MRSPSIALLVVGTKGLRFTNDVMEVASISSLVTYDSDVAGDPNVEDFRAVAERAGARFLEARRPRHELFDGVDIVFAVGWQFLLTPAPTGLVVLHDSLLPRYRGFAPTVTALINGDRAIGVTAITPVDRTDAGPVLFQAPIDIEPPITIADAFTRLRPCYLRCARGVLESWAGSIPAGTPQDEAEASYSIWRDHADYQVDWHDRADRIVRQILALGPPYAGARSVVNGEVVVVGSAQEIPDVNFVDRAPGKVWSISDRGVDVVCGQGMVRLTNLAREDGREFCVDRLRTRFG